MLRQALLALAQSNAGGSSVKRQGGRCLEYAAAWAWAAEWPRKGRRFSTTTKANQEARRKTAVTNPSSVVRQYKPLPEGWETIIGVEVHAQLKSKRKLFSSARTPVTSAGEDTAGGDQADNTLVAYYDASLPGSLPTMQEEALLLAMRACLALDCAVGDVVTFDRKHYLYADLPGGFQVTQKYAPLAKDGKLRLLYDDGYLPTKEEEVDVRIEQVQLEQDTGKSTHGISDTSGAMTLVDLNRAGSALIEIVSGPDMRSPEQAGAYVRKLRDVLRHIGASDGNMDEGSMRCDVNVSVHRFGQPWGLRCEVKNLNSIKFVMNAITHEMHRQQTTLEAGERIQQETRGFDVVSGTTFKLRSKEDAPDYRYMPDQNLPAIHINDAMVDSIRAWLPELADEQRARLVAQYGIGIREANVLMRIGLGDEEEPVPNTPGPAKGASSTPETVDPVRYFEALANGRDGPLALNWLIHELLKALNAVGKTFGQNPVRARDFGELIDLVQSGKVTLSTARGLLSELVSSSDDCASPLRPFVAAQPQSTIEALLRSRDSMALDANGALEALCADAIKALPQEAALVRAGKDKVVMRLVGEVMKRAKGRADAKAAKERLLAMVRA